MLLTLWRIPERAILHPIVPADLSKQHNGREMYWAPRPILPPLFGKLAPLYVLSCNLVPRAHQLVMRNMRGSAFWTRLGKTVLTLPQGTASAEVFIKRSRNSEVAAHEQSILLTPQVKALACAPQLYGKLEASSSRGLLLLATADLQAGCSVPASDQQCTLQVDGKVFLVLEHAGDFL